MNAAFARYRLTSKEGAASCQAARMEAHRTSDVNGATSTAEMARRLARLDKALQKADRQYELCMKEAWDELAYEQCEQEAIGMYC